MYASQFHFSGKENLKEKKNLKIFPYVWRTDCTLYFKISSKVREMGGSINMGINTTARSSLAILQEGAEGLTLARTQRSTASISTIAFIQPFLSLSSGFQDIPMLLVLGGRRQLWTEWLERSFTCFSGLLMSTKRGYLCLACKQTKQQLSFCL